MTFGVVYLNNCWYGLRNSYVKDLAQADSGQIARQKPRQSTRSIIRVASFGGNGSAS